MATGFNVRVGDADRDAVATQLREHYADGRLTLDELNERLDQAFAARTRADLNAVTRDLPPHIGWPTASPPGPAGWHADWNSQSRQGGPGDGSGNAGPRRSGLLATAALLLSVLIAVGGFLALAGLFAFGFPGGRPLGIVFFFAALAMIRRMFGRRRRYVRGYGRCGRRW
ncbi:MAG TPA: DUF1707 domain-containing protein [Streptosporangiaceae bacterium]|jgi:hypothetical protein|nr:DUF1707 domain-containing protein [Streptosporangiaceae bacterium]